MLVCINTNLELEKYLLEKNFDVNSVSNNGRNAFHYSCLSNGKNSLEIVKILLNYEINIEKIDNYGHSPFNYACVRWHYNDLKMLFELMIKKNF